MSTIREPAAKRVAGVEQLAAAWPQAQCGDGAQCEPGAQQGPQCFEPQQQSNEETPNGNQA